MLKTDRYANNIANIGSITNNSAGKYLMRFDSENPGVQTDGLDKDYKAYLNLPTPYGIALLRILAKANANDTQIVTSLQNEFYMKLAPRSGPPVAPALNLSIFQGPGFNTNPSTTTVASLVFNLTAQLAPYNEPYVAYDRSWVRQSLRNAGISFENKNFTRPSSTNMTEAIATADASVKALQTTPGLTLRLGNNWTASASQIIGAYSSFYTARFSTAVRGYLALTSEQAIYPATSDYNISDSQALLFQFPSKPELKPGGFWSLTLYNEAQYFIKNDLNRYALGDRSNLTFPDGSLLSEEGKDGMFEILCQANDVPPPTNWTGNWLPTTSGGGTVKITRKLRSLRYGCGTYFYSEVLWRRGFDDERRMGLSQCEGDRCEDSLRDMSGSVDYNPLK